MTGDGGGSRSPNPGVGGFSYGLFLGPDTTVERLEDVAFELGAAGPGAPPAAPTSRD